MAKQDKELRDLANSIGGFGRAEVRKQMAAQKPAAQPQATGRTAPKAAPQVSKAKAMDTYAHANDFLKRYDAPKPKAAPRAKATTVKKASGRGR